MSMQSEVFEPGKAGRKTGYYITKTPKKNSNGLEDVNDFFLSDEEYESRESHSQQSKQNSKKILFKKSKNKPLKFKEKSSNIDIPTAYDSSTGGEEEDAEAEELDDANARTSHHIESESDDDREEDNNEEEDEDARERLLLEDDEAEGRAEEEEEDAEDAEDEHDEENEDEEDQDEDAAENMIQSAALAGSPIKPIFRKRSNLNGSQSKSSLGESSSNNSKFGLFPSPIKKSKNIEKKSTYLQTMEELNDNDEDHSDTDKKISSAINNKIPKKSSKKTTSKTPKPSAKGASIMKSIALGKGRPAKSRKYEFPEQDERQRSETAEENGGSIRRSSRTKIKPVAFWRNEKVVYERDDAEDPFDQKIKEIIHVPEVIPEKRRQSYYYAPIVPPLSQSKKSSTKSNNTAKPKARNNKRKASEIIEEVDVDEIIDAEPENLENGEGPEDELQVEDGPEEDYEEEEETKSIKKGRPQKKKAKKATNSKKAKPTRAPPAEASEDEVSLEEPIESIQGAEWIDDGSLLAPIFEGPGSENMIERTIAWAPNRAKNVSVIQNNEEMFKIATLFDQDSEFSGGGIIEIPVGSRKAIKSNDDTYFIFYVIDGVLEVTISHNTFVAKKGCSFEVPMGNFYQFENIHNNSVKLFFVQAKYVVVEPSDDAFDSE
ncbi:hypothetical protein B5S28_g3985 [[Candida] boidinii]|nr:hypothetical protein B5S28_g3985 [[Candida] boidinii]OWB61923.1 hypothetical protein B5S29_g2829 [[Candida] boidinii]OWB71589.1 hypothetical protein B5S31_g1279 [[Candida] boidinii]